MIFAVAMLTAGAGCYPLYTNVEDTTIRFLPNTSEVSLEASREVSARLQPLAGKPLAEIHFTVNFPYGANEGDSDWKLAEKRRDNLRLKLVSIGISQDLVGGGMSAIGFRFSENYDTYRVPFDPDQLDTVVIQSKVKSPCHPLLDLALRLNPY